MNCKDIQVQIIDDCAANQATDIPPELLKHVEGCRDCSQVLRDFKLVCSCYKQSFESLPIPQSLPAVVVSRTYEKVQLKRLRLKRRWGYKVWPAAAIVLVGLVVYFFFIPAPTRILDGRLFVEMAEKGIKNLGRYDSLPIGQVLKTSADQSAKIKLRDGSIIELSPETILTIKQDNGRLLKLEEGELDCRVAKGGGFSIDMPGAQLKTLGTEFVVRLSTNRKSIITSQNKALSFITSAAVKVAASSGRILLTTNSIQGKIQQDIQGGETVIREINQPLPEELQIEIKYLINQLGNENKMVQEEAFTALLKIGYTIVPFIEEIPVSNNTRREILINRLRESFQRPKILWSQNISRIGLVLYSPVVSDNQLYLVSESGLSARDCFNGSVKWKFERAGFNSVPLVVNGVVYIGTLDGYFFALETKEGKVIWQQKGLGGIQAQPIIFNNMLYIGSGEKEMNKGKFYALDVRDGGIKWKFDTDGIIVYSQAAIFNEAFVLLGDWKNKFYLLDAQTGEKIWEYQTNGKIVTSPVVAEGLVYLGSGDGNLYVLSGLSGEKLSSYQSDSAIIESPFKWSENIYWGTKHKIYALDLGKRCIIWTYNRERDTPGTLLVKNGQIYFGTDSGRLIVLDALTGEKACDFEMPPGDIQSKVTYYNVISCPVIFKDIIYITACSIGDSLTNDRVYALKLK
jgi:eukaryotic-like serine/threonine-protein kinase